MSKQTDKIKKFAAVGIGAALLGKELVSRAPRFSFRNKSVAITGGSRGLGLVLARKLAEQGAKISICARHAGEIETAKAELGEFGSGIFASVIDVTHRDQATTFIRDVVAHFGSLDALVNNAGVIEVGPLDAMAIEDFEQAMQTHFWAPLYLSLAALPHLRRHSESRIINIISFGGKLSVPHLLPYSASKFALAGLSEGLHHELAKDGIKVTSVYPGLMRTGSTKNAWFKGKHRKEHDWFTLGASTPFLSMRAETAAKRILSASKRGDAELVLGFPAKIAVKANGLFPETTRSILSVVNRLLPQGNGSETQKFKGRESESALTKSFLTRLDKSAAERNNE